jgi:hypothetical protein
MCAFPFQDAFAAIHSREAIAQVGAMKAVDAAADVEKGTQTNFIAFLSDSLTFWLCFLSVL